jgi:DNA-binding transcriptional ArsR family regulator
VIRIAELKKSYYAIIPAEVRYDEELPPNAKLLYGEITSLCNEKGYCWATNQYFADLYKVSKITVSRWISTLYKKGYIAVETLYKEGTKEIIERHLYIVNTPINKNVNRYIQNDLEGINEIVNTPINKNVKDNNKVINTKINNKLKVSKHKYGEYSHVLLTDKEHTHLLDLYGDSLDEHIKILDEYIETSGKKYKNHSLVIQKWVHDEWMKRNKNNPVNPVKLDSKFYAQESNQSYADVQKEMERVRREILRA